MKKPAKPCNLRRPHTKLTSKYQIPEQFCLSNNGSQTRTKVSSTGLERFGRKVQGSRGRSSADWSLRRLLRDDKDLDINRISDRTFTAMAAYQNLRHAYAPLNTHGRQRRHAVTGLLVAVFKEFLFSTSTPEVQVLNRLWACSYQYVEAPLTKHSRVAKIGDVHGPAAGVQGTTLGGYAPVMLLWRTKSQDLAQQPVRLKGHRDSMGPLY